MTKPGYSKVKFKYTKIFFKFSIYYMLAESTLKFI